MAVRLAVIMIESAPSTAAAGRFAADVVGNLIGRPGLDLTLVRSLTIAEMSETDRLSLEAISGDVAVLDWQSPESMLESLASMGMSGCRWPHRQDPHTAPEPAADRRIYAFDLRCFGEPMELVEALENLNKDRQTQTFVIGNSISAVGKKLPTVTGTSSPAQPLETSRGPNPTSTHRHRSTEHRPLPSIDLDDLIDQLDQSDQS